jgi:hypothetical protein
MMDDLDKQLLESVREAYKKLNGSFRIDDDFSQANFNDLTMALAEFILQINEDE